MNSTDVRQQRKRAVTAHEADLGQRWTEAYDCWVDAPGTTAPLYARPQPHPNEHGTNAWPDAVRQSCKLAIFGITASNPLGQEFPVEYNLQANQRLEQELRQLVVDAEEAAAAEKSSSSTSKDGDIDRSCAFYWWHSYGFGDGWREDGFVVMSCERSKILELAIKYQQGAVYEFVFSNTAEPWVVIRKTIPVLLSPIVEAETRMITVDCETIGSFIDGKNLRV